MWSMDVALPAVGGSLGGGGGGGAPRPAAGAADVEEVSGAWKHVRNVVREDAKSAELYDLLSHSVRETQYSFQPQGVSGRGRPRPRGAGRALGG